MGQLFVLLLSVLFLRATDADTSRVELYRRQSTHTTPDEPTQTGTISTCNLWYDVVSGDTCASVEAAFNITSAEFLVWNPAVSSDCSSGFWAGDSYCVGVGTASSVTPTSTATTTASSKTAETTGPAEPTQTGQPSTCDAWYDVVSGDNCPSIEAAFNITLAQFLAWNPAVSSDCSSGLWAGYAYCVGVNPNATSTTTSTRSMTPSASSTSISIITPTGTYSILPGEMSAVLAPIPTATAWPPSPTQSGILSTCLRYYQANIGDTCQSITNMYSHLITLDDFLTWNPSVGGVNCTGLYVNWYYCVDAPMDQSNLPNATTQYLPGWTPEALPILNATFDPFPIAPGLISSCQAYYEANPNDTCDSVVSALGYLDVSEFQAWNTGVNCSDLSVSTYYCVANYTTLPPPPTVSTLPSPVPSGTISTCTSWYQAIIGDDCTVIPEYFGTFGEADFVSWNPSVGSNCSGLVFGDYYCVAIPGSPATRTATASASALPTSGVGPQPQQPGIPATAAYTGLWAPPGSDCSGLEPDYYVCVGMPGTTTVVTTTSSPTGNSVPSSTVLSTVTESTAPSSTVPPRTTTVATTTGVSGATPTPVQTGMVSGCERFYYVESGDDCYDIALDANIDISDFYSWNPAVGSSCQTLEADVYVCIGITGPPITITSGTPVPATPLPTQTGMVTGCVRFYLVEPGNDCYDIALDAGISLSNFYAWNPAIGSSCQALEADVFVCIGTVGLGTTITTGTPVPAPTTTS